jgi:hypothetical protein
MVIFASRVGHMKIVSGGEHYNTNGRLVGYINKFGRLGGHAN